MDIFMSCTRRGERVFFVADTWNSARIKASLFAGKGYRYVQIVQPGSRIERIARAELGV